LFDIGICNLSIAINVHDARVGTIDPKAIRCGEDESFHGLPHFVRTSKYARAPMASNRPMAMAVRMSRRVSFFIVLLSV
jgi:hypothetical protein